MQVIRYTVERTDEWNEFIASSKNSTFLLDRRFMDYHSDRFTDHSLIIQNESGKLVAVLPANEKEDCIISHAGLTYGGLVIHPKVKMGEYLHILHAILEYLESQNFKTLQIKDIPSFYKSGFADELSYAAFLCDATPYRRDITVCHDKEFPDKFSSRRKRGAKRAIKEGVELRFSSDFASFWTEVLTPNLKEKYGVTPVHSLEEIELLSSRFPEYIKQVDAVYEGNTVAGTTLFITPNVVHAQYISANDQGRELGALDLLFDHLINNEYQDRRFFDFGIVNEESGRKVNKGLLDWKEGFGSRVALHDFYEFRTSSRNQLIDIYL